MSLLSSPPGGADPGEISAGEEPSQVSPSVLFGQCEAEFEALLPMIREQNDAGVLRTKADDEYGRLRVWGHDFLQSSLGDTLLDKEMRDIVTTTFKSLHEQLTTGMCYDHRIITLLPC